MNQITVNAIVEALSAYKLVLWDLDGTLVETWTDKLLPKRLEIVSRLRAREVAQGVCTNQAGPWYRIMTGDTKYPTIRDVTIRLSSVCDKLGITKVFVAYAGDSKEANGASLPNDWGMGHMPRYTGLGDLTVMECWDPNWRKPNPGMLVAARGGSFIPDVCCYVGDHGTDELAAQAASVRYYDIADLTTGVTT